MSNRNNLYIFGIVVLILVVVVAAFIFLDSVPESADGQLQVRMGLVGTPDILDIPYFIAQDKGLFEEEGLEVEFIQLHGDPITIQSLLSGDIDVAASGHFAVINAAREGLPVKAVVSVQRSHDYVLAVPKDITGFSQLKGKKIGIFASGDITEIVTLGILKKHGLSARDVQWIAVGGSTDRYRALLTGEVAAVPLHADFGYKIRQSEDYHVLVSIADEIPLPMSTVSTSVEIIQSRSEIPEKLTRALIRASRIAVEDKNTFIQIANKHIEEIEAEGLLKVYDFLIEQEIYGVNGGINEESIKNGIQALKATENIEGEILVSQVADFSFINKIVSELGIYQYQEKAENE